MSGSLVLAQEDFELKVMYRSTEGNAPFLGVPPPTYTFPTLLMYDETTGFIIEHYNNDPNQTRVLFYDMTSGNPTVVYRPDGSFHYSGLIEFIPYQNPNFPVLNLYFNLSPRAYQDVLYKWQELTEPKPYFVLDLDQWIQANAEVQSLKIAQQNAAYAAYLAQQKAFQAKQEAESEMVRRIAAEVQIEQLHAQLEQMSIGSISDELYISRSGSVATSVSLSPLQSDVSADKSPVFFSPKSTAVAKKVAQVAPKPSMTWKDVKAMILEQLTGYPATLQDIYQLLNGKFMKKMPVDQVLRIFAEITIPITICEDLLYRNIPKKIKIALLHKILSYSDEECLQKLKSPQRIVNVANEFRNNEKDLRDDILDKMRSIPHKPRARPVVVNLEESVSNDSITPAKARAKAKRPSKAELVGELFNLLNTKNFSLKDIEKFAGFFDQLNHHGQTALMVAIQNQLDPKVIEYIQENTSPRYIVHLDPNQKSILHYWAEYMPQKVGLFDSLYQDYSANLTDHAHADLKALVDNNGETFLHILLKKNVSPRNVSSVLKVIQGQHENNPVILTTVIRDRDGNSPLKIIQGKDSGWKDTKDLLLNAVVDAGFYLMRVGERGKLSEEFVDVFNLSNPNNLIHRLIAKDDEAELISVLIDRGYIRAQLDVFSDSTILAMFGEHDLPRELALLLQENTVENERKLNKLIDLCLELESSYKNEEDIANANHNLLHSALCEIAVGNIEIGLGVALVRKILERSDDKLAIISHFDTTFFSALDGCLDVILQNPDRIEGGEILQTLIEHGADVTAVDEYSQNMLHKICLLYDANVLRTFLRVANISPKTIEEMFKAKDKEGRTPNQIASEDGKQDILDIRKQNLATVLRTSLKG